MRSRSPAPIVLIDCKQLQPSGRAYGPSTTSAPTRRAVQQKIPGTDQRNAIIYASTVDLEESYKVGIKCAEIACKDGNGWMGTIIREPGNAYSVRYDKVALDKVANSERFFPKDWIAENRYDVTDDFIRYAMPLIGRDWPSIPLVGGLQRFTRFKKVFADKMLEDYVPQGYRE